MKKFTVSFIAALLSSLLYAQQCAVDMPALKGTYTGECKKGKAHGQGLATGNDSYEGNFKAGLPDGQGIYTWRNGNRYNGQFAGGLKEGKGTMLYKRENAADSIVEGYWKKDSYMGRDAEPWRLIFKSKLVTDVEVEFKDNPYRRITFFITNTSGGSHTVEGNEWPRMKIDEIQVMTGAYGRLFVNDNHAKKTECVIEEIIYPFRFKAQMGEEQVEFEFTKPGSYVVTLQVNN